MQQRKSVCASAELQNTPGPRWLAGETTLLQREKEEKAPPHGRLQRGGVSAQAVLQNTLEPRRLERGST